MTHARLVYSFCLLALSAMVSFNAQAAQFCDTETIVTSPSVVGEDLEFTVQVWNDDCGVQDPATWGSTYVQLIRFGLETDVLHEVCIDANPDHQGFYDVTESFNLGALIDRRGVYQVRARPYSSDVCNGDRGLNDTDTFNVQDPSLESATFLASAAIGDGNPTTIDVSINCTTGLPISQMASITRIQPVEFVVESFASGELQCTIVAEEIPGYQAYHADGQDADGSSCQFSMVEQGDAYGCLITYQLLPIDVEVSKLWLFDEAENAIEQEANATLSCQNILLNEFMVTPTNASWPLSFHGDETKTVSVLPFYLGNSVCSVTETNSFSSAVEIDDSDCQGVQLPMGSESVGCTIVNTVFFEGIPTVNRFGMAVLIMLMIVLGIAGYRRYS